MGGAPAPSPMGGASDVPPMGDMGPTGPTGDPAGAPMDGMADGNGVLDPTMGGEPPMGNEPPMDEPAAEGGEDDSTMSIINQLKPEDREAVRSYAESMLSRDETQDEDPAMGGEEEMGNGPIPDAQGDGQPMMESVVFTKGQLKHIHENFNNNEKEKENNGNNKMRKNTSKNSPFNAPKFD